MPLEPVKHTKCRVIDIDGTVVKKKASQAYFTTPTEALPGAVDKVNAWFDAGDYIIFWTARPDKYKDKTIEILDNLGFKYHEVVCGKPYCHEIHLYDDNDMIFHKVTRDIGIGGLLDNEYIFV